MTDGPNFEAIKEKVSLKQKLLKPEIPANKPLDKVFEEVVHFLESPSQNDISSANLIEHIYAKLRDEAKEAEQSPYLKRKLVIQRSLELIHQIQTLSNAEKAKAKNKDLITISLPDMKIFGELLNFVILQGFYAALPRGVGIPLEHRRLNNLAKTAVKVSKVGSADEATDLLTLLTTNFVEIFNKGGDVRTLLARGSGYSDLLIAAIYLALSPTKPRTETSTATLKKVESLSSTYELFSIYTLLLQPYSQPWLKAYASQRLSLLTIERKDGVVSLIEFVVGMRDDEEINIEKVDHVSRILISKPTAVDPITYFRAIGQQLLDILVLINRPALTSIATHVIESIFERNQNIVIDFIFQKIWTSWAPPENTAGASEKVLVSEKDLNNSFNIILSLTKRASPELIECALGKLIIPLWSYHLFKKGASQEVGLVKDMLVSYFTITNNVVSLDTLVKNLLVVDGENWKYAIGDNGLVEIRSKGHSSELSNEEFFNMLDKAVDSFILILKEVDDELVKREFSLILKRWLKVSDVEIESLSADENPYLLLIDLRLLESIVQNFKDQLSKSPYDMLVVVKTVLMTHEKPSNNEPRLTRDFAKAVTVQDDADSDDEDDDDDDDDYDYDAEGNTSEVSESLKVVLELLSAILSESLAENMTQDTLKLMKEIVQSLSKLKAANKSAESLYERMTSLLDATKSRPLENEESIDKRTLERAIVSLNDPLVPIRAHGLFLLRQLTLKKSNVISLEFVIDLHLVQLKDPEPFVYLNVIKGLEALINFDKNETLPVLLRFYSKRSTYSMDERLRIGEVLLRFITNSNDTLSGDISSSLTSVALDIVRIPSDVSEKQPNTLRMSAMSLLGMCCKTNPVGMIDQLPDCFDCVLGILQLETSKDENVMRRAAVVLVHDLISGPGGLELFPKDYGQKCVNVLKFVLDTDDDPLVRGQAEQVIIQINELLRLAFTPEQNESTQRFKVVG